MTFITKDEFKDLIEYNLGLGVSKATILENAAVKIIKHINLDMRQTFAVICGTGDNGEYGLALARNLISLGKYVDIFILDTNEESTIEFRNQFRIIEKSKANIKFLETLGELESFENDLSKVNTIIDAITGIDYSPNFTGVLEFIIEKINRSRIHIISVDIPSGLDYDTGRTKISPVIADMVVTFEKLKKPLEFTFEMVKTKVVVEKIGLIERGENVRYKTY